MCAEECYAIIKEQLAPSIGDTFNSRDLMHKIDALDYRRLYSALHKLSDEGKVRFTGTTCIFKRLV